MDYCVSYTLPDLVCSLCADDNIDWIWDKNAHETSRIKIGSNYELLLFKGYYDL